MLMLMLMLPSCFGEGEEKRNTVHQYEQTTNFPVPILNSKQNLSLLLYALMYEF